MATTAFLNVTNSAKTTLNGAINALVTACSVASGTSLPSVPFVVKIYENDEDVYELVKVTAKSGASITTMVRGQQGTAPNSWADGANFQVVWTASNVTELQTAINNLETRLGDGTGDVTIATGDLDVLRDGAVLNPTWKSYYGGANNLIHDFMISRGSVAVPAIVQNLDEVALKFWGHDGAAMQQFAAITAYINGTPGLSDMPGGLAFKVSPDGGVTPATALTLAQNLLATFYGAVTMSSTLAVTGAVTCSSTMSATNSITTGTGAGTANREFRAIAGSGYFGLVRFLGWDGVSANVNRWAIGKGNTSESGSSAGSEFLIAAYTDAGVFIDYPVTITRAQYGATNFNRPVVFNSNRRETPKVITYAATITPNMRDGNYQQCTLTGNVTIAAPSNVAAGDMLEIVLVQDGTGSRTATWNSVYKFASGDTGTLTTTASKKDTFTFRAYDATNLICTGIKKNI